MTKHKGAHLPNKTMCPSCGEEHPKSFFETVYSGDANRVADLAPFLGARVCKRCMYPPDGTPPWAWNSARRSRNKAQPHDPVGTAFGLEPTIDKIKPGLDPELETAI